MKVNMGKGFSGSKRERNGWMKRSRVRLGILNMGKVLQGLVFGVFWEKEVLVRRILGKGGSCSPSYFQLVL